MLVKDEHLKDAKELLEEIKQYKEIFGTEVTDYLNALVNLEANIWTSEMVSPDSIERLKEFILYRDIVLFNAYNYVLNYLTNVDKHLVDYYLNSFENSLFRLKILDNRHCWPDCGTSGRMVNLEFKRYVADVEKRNNIIEEIVENIDFRKFIPCVYLNDGKECLHAGLAKDFYKECCVGKFSEETIEKLINILRQLYGESVLTKEQIAQAEASQYIFEILESEYELGKNVVTYETPEITDDSLLYIFLRQFDINQYQQLEEHKLIKQHPVGVVSSYTRYY